MSDNHSSGQAAPHKRILTGIKPTGIPHLGNYVGAIRPAIQSIQNSDSDAFFFLADYHSIIGAMILRSFTSQPKPLPRHGSPVVSILSA